MNISAIVLANNNDNTIEKTLKSLVDFNDVDKMASGIIELAGDNKLRKTMGAESRRLAVSQFDLLLHSQSIENIYLKILTKNWW